jgi:hypothetical protein
MSRRLLVGMALIFIVGAELSGWAQATIRIAAFS